MFMLLIEQKLSWNSHDVRVRVGEAAGRAGLSKRTPPYTQNCPWWRSPRASTAGSRKWVASEDPCASIRAWCRRGQQGSFEGTACGSRVLLDEGLQRLSCLEKWKKTLLIASCRWMTWRYRFLSIIRLMVHGLLKARKKTSINHDWSAHAVRELWLVRIVSLPSLADR